MVGRAKIGIADRYAVGKVVKAAMAKLQMTGESVAYQAFGNQDRKSHVSEIANGKGRHSASTFEKVCNVLGIDRGQLPESCRWRDAVPNTIRLLPQIGKPLEFSTIAVASHQARRQSVAGSATWLNLLGGAYMLRADLVGQAKDALDEWEQGLDATVSGGKVPLFWIGGRSGDGKSALLLQLVYKRLAIKRQTTFIQARNGETIIGVLEWLTKTRPSSDNGRKVFIVVDDLHILHDPRQVFEQITHFLSDDRFLIGIIACGPTREFEIFDKKIQRFTSSVMFECPPHDQQDRKDLAAWFGVCEPDSNFSPDQLLVETLFEFAIGDDLESFAYKFKNRLKSINLFEATKAALSMNAFDMLAPFTLIPDALAKHAFARMSIENHLHFERGDQFGVDGFRLIHSKIAWKLFELWIHEDAPGADILEFLSEYIVDSLRKTPISAHNYINTFLNIARTRVHDLLNKGYTDDPGTAALFARHCLKGAKKSPSISAYVARAAIEWVPKGDFVSPEVIELATAARDNDQATDHARMFIAATLARKRARIPLVEHEAHVVRLRTMLENAAFKRVASPGLMTLLSLDEHRPFATRRSASWIKEFPDEPGTMNLLARLIGLNGDDDTVLTAAIQWIDIVDKKARSASVLAALLRQQNRSSAVKARALNLVKDESPESWHQAVVSALIASYKSDGKVKDEARQWLEKARQLRGSETVLVSFISSYAIRDAHGAVSLSEEDLKFVLGWVDAADHRPGLEGVLRTLVKKTSGHKDVIDCALKWMRTTKKSLDMAQVVTTLLKYAGTRADVLEEAKHWLDGSGLRIGALEVVKAYVIATSGNSDATDRALKWLQQNLSSSGSEQVLGTLLARVGPRQDIVEITLRWLDENGTGKRAGDVLRPMFSSRFWSGASQCEENSLTRLRELTARFELIDQHQHCTDSGG